MVRNCKCCMKFFVCGLKKFLPFPEYGCSDFVFCKKSRFVLVHLYRETNFYSLVAFSNYYKELVDIQNSQSHFGSKHHDYFICDNTSLSSVVDLINEIKDKNLINICRNVAFGLARAEYHMLKHRYTKSKFCFDKTKKQISDACYILDNY